jgi:coenzyme PQQ precursor peptide PqqA
MKWTTPAAQDMRYGFEITMYFMTRKTKRAERPFSLDTQ